LKSRKFAKSLNDDGKTGIVVLLAFLIEISATGQGYRVAAAAFLIKYILNMYLLSFKSLLLLNIAV